MQSNCLQMPSGLKTICVAGSTGCHRLLLQQRPRLSRYFLPLSTRRTYFTRWQDVEKTRRQDEYEREKMRQVIDPKTGGYITYEDWQRYDIIPQKPFADRTHEDMNHPGFDKISFLSTLRYKDLSPLHLRQSSDYRRLLYLQYDQRFIPERLLILGPDLTAAHFLLHRGMSVKFAHLDKWFTDRNVIELPTSFAPDWKVEAIDAADGFLMWEGFDNLVKLKDLRLLHLAHCDYFDDWCIDRLQEYQHSLEFLDLSYNDRISAHGLTALSCMKKLRYLRLDGLNDVQGIAQAALSLEAAIPGLAVVGLDYGRALEQVRNDNRLLQQPGVYEDAKGVVYLKDEQEECYYLKGLRHEKPIRDQHRLPLYMSKIRMDPPDVTPEDAERINRLCEGKLKHLLVGSPSGEWTVETERILSFEAYYMLKEGKTIEPVMLPECMKREAPQPSLLDRVKRYLPMEAENESTLPPLLTEVKKRVERDPGAFIPPVWTQDVSDRSQLEDEQDPKVIGKGEPRVEGFLDAALSKPENDDCGPPDQKSDVAKDKRDDSLKKSSHASTAVLNADGSEQPTSDYDTVAKTLENGPLSLAHRGTENVSVSSHSVDNIDKSLTKVSSADSNSAAEHTDSDNYNYAPAKSPRLDHSKLTATEIEREMRRVLLPDPDAPISHEVKSQPPTPRPRRIFSKYTRYSGHNVS